MTSDLKSLIESKKLQLQKRAKYSPHEFQAYGYFLSENLNDLAHRSIYISLAKKTPRQILDTAYHETKEAATKLTGKSAQAKFFMWKVKNLKQAIIESGDEFVDIFDEQENFLNVDLKSQANKKPDLIHRHAGIFLYNKNRELLFQKRSQSKDTNPGKWSMSAAGHVTSGESPEQAIKRELKEELGIRAKPIFIEKSFLKKTTETSFNYNFFASLNEIQKLKINSHELDRVEFMSQQKLEEYLGSGQEIGEKSYEYALRFWTGEFNDRIRK